MIILGIETSCDETAVALVKDGTKVLSSSVASSEEIHKKYGGIIPEKAAREQVRSMIPVLKEALESSRLKAQGSRLKLKIQKYQNLIDAIAVTVGPGLIGSLLVGVETAKTLAWLWDKPIVPVNHLIAHIYGNFLQSPITHHPSPIIFPSLCLIVSGGHTELVLMKDHGKFQWIGGTRDDAAGECFDKTSRLLGLGYPGGPAIAAAAAMVDGPSSGSGNSTRLIQPCFKPDPSAGRQGSRLKANLKLPRPMINDDNLDFSFSGLKTAVLNKIKTMKQLSNETIKQLSYEIQEAITDVLVKKTLKAAEKYKVKSILVGGGVAANSRLREKFESIVNSQLSKVKLFIPNKKFCTDNAAVIASNAFFNFKPIPWRKIKANPGLEIIDKL